MKVHDKIIDKFIVLNKETYIKVHNGDPCGI